MKTAIQDTSCKAIQTISSCGLDIDNAERLQECLLNVSRSNEAGKVFNKAGSVFSGLRTKTAQDNESLKKFLNGWQATHVTALYVAGMIIRVQREAHEAKKAGEEIKSGILNDVAYHLGEVIAEDTGVVGIPHGAMYERFAGAMVRDNSWKREQYSLRACDDFRTYLEKARLRAPLEDAILTTAASELWNTGEYTCAAPHTRHLLEKMNIKNPVAANAYVAVHAGDTELDHFTHVLKAWQLYCEAEGIEAKPEKAASVLRNYISRLEPAFSALDDCLSESATPKRGYASQFNTVPHMV